jgi:hypothetical protein
LINKYSDVIESTKNNIKEIKEFEEKQLKLKTELLKLEEIFNSSLKTFELKELNKILETSLPFLSEIEDNEVKEKWKEYNDIYKTVKLLLDDIERLSLSAINALNNRSFSESLDFFEQIITQLQEYQK